MGERVSRRGILRAGLVTAAGVAGLDVAVRIADRYGLIPPDHGGIYGLGETLTYASQRLLTSRASMAREFTRVDISKVAPVNGGPPTLDEYLQLFARDWADWRLVVDGLVARPHAFSLGELMRFPSRTQITHQACEEGWSFIAEWTGVPLAHILNLVGASPKAKFVVALPFDRAWESIDMADAWHPQTLLAYRMNGDVLPTGHGAPLRLRVERQLGYKSVKYLRRLTVTDSIQAFGKGLGGSNPEDGYSWYAGI
jgi:DMSO/TMAO reductase YedYZ molybdopterin-dependent catalytic subunit